LALSALLATTLFPQPGPSAKTTVHIGFSARCLANANRADLIAAMKVWLLTVTKERKLALIGEPEIFDSLSDMQNALRREQIDVINAPTDEFVLLENIVPLANIFVSQINGRITEQYVLLVNKDRVIKDFRDLRGDTLVVLDNPRTVLATLWLDTELMRTKLPVSARLFGKITHVKKPNLAILPVFFKQTGVALVTRASFETAGELNPQLTKNVRVLTSSPEWIPTVGAFRATAISGAVELYRREALKIQESQGGKLVLNLFQTDGVVEIKESDLAGTRALLAEYARLKAEGVQH
jgi:ABC-type phosphate/phosphonate transport system substrate-binding protein